MNVKSGDEIILFQIVSISLYFLQKEKKFIVFLDQYSIFPMCFVLEK